MAWVLVGVLGLLMSALLVVLMAAPGWLGVAWGRRIRSPLARTLPVLVLVGVPLVWAVAGYRVFEARCTQVPPPVYALRLQQPATGFLSRSEVVNWHPLLAQGPFGFVEVPAGPATTRRNTAGPRPRADAPAALNTVWIDNTAAQASYVLLDTPPEPLDLCWHPPVRLHHLELRELASDRLVARATDLVYGGGLVGLYLRLLGGGDQDMAALSCGYASADIGPWRPTLTSRPRYRQYQEADDRFLRLALGHPDPL